MTNENFEFKSAGELLREGELESLRNYAESLIEKARACNAVVTIELKPLEPLAMGNYMMVADVRHYCASAGIDFDAADEVAVTHFEAERGTA